MGIPRYFRWISERYPLCVKDCTVNSKPPIDNFFIDVNSIIYHKSFRNMMEADIPHLLPSSPWSDIFTRIFGYIEHLVEIVHPGKLLYVAVDGVAP
jgi:5'-3' exoribonuclease 1